MRPTRCPGEWHTLRFVTDSIAMCVGGHEAVLWELAGGRVRLEPSRVARALADRLVATMDALELGMQSPAPSDGPVHPLQAPPVADDPVEAAQWVQQPVAPLPWAGVSLARVPIDGRVFAELRRHQRAGHRPVLTSQQWTDVRQAFLDWQEMHRLKSKDIAKMAGVGRGVLTEMTTGAREGRQPVPPALRPFLIACVLTVAGEGRSQ